MIKENFIKLYENSFKENWDLPCYTDYGEDTTFTYGQVAEEIAKIHLLFQYCSLRRGDKISIIGKNTSRWCIAYLATVTYGAIVVPILQDFKPNDVHHIVNHSESTFLFTSDNYKPQNKMFHFCKTFCSKITLVNTIQNVILNPI